MLQTVQTRMPGAGKFLWGFCSRSEYHSVGFFIQAMNDSLTEVKLTVYEGSINSTVGDSEWRLKQPKQFGTKS